MGEEKGKRAKVKYCLNNRRVMATRVKERFQGEMGRWNGARDNKITLGTTVQHTHVHTLFLPFRRFSKKTVCAIRFRSNCAKMRVDEDARGNVLRRRNVVNSASRRFHYKISLVVYLII